MANYVKVTKMVADVMGITAIRNYTKDGNVLLWQKDVCRFPGTTLDEQVSYCGGAKMDSYTAKKEIDGKSSIPVATPEIFRMQYEGTKPAEDIDPGFSRNPAEGEDVDSGFSRPSEDNGIVDEEENGKDSKKKGGTK